MDSRISARALSAALGGWRTREPAYEALADGIRLLCLDNRLAPRTALPAERELSAALRAEPQHRRRRLPEPSRHRAHREHARFGQRHAAAAAPRSRPCVDDATARSICSRRVRRPGRDSPGVIADVALIGIDARLAGRLRRARADRAARGDRRAVLAARHPDLAAARSLVTTGAQSAIHLLASVLLGRGDRVLIETPTYPHAADALRRAGARLVGVPVTTEDGWDLDRAEQAFARTLPVLAYLMPDFQNPTGRSMTAIERATIAAGRRARGNGPGAR